MLSRYLWLTSLSMIICMSVHVPADGFVLLLFMAECSPLCICHISVTHSFVAHLGCFHALLTVNSAAVNTGVHVSFQVSFLQIYVPDWDCRIIYRIVFVRTESGYQDGSISGIHLLT